MYRVCLVTTSHCPKLYISSRWTSAWNYAWEICRTWTMSPYRRESIESARYIIGPSSSQKFTKLSWLANPAFAFLSLALPLLFSPSTLILSFFLKNMKRHDMIRLHKSRCPWQRRHWDEMIVLEKKKKKKHFDTYGASSCSPSSALTIPMTVCGGKNKNNSYNRTIQLQEL